jgi:murein DD-endopeptidase MepM/ murein hydrolase activator NlpD
LHSGIDIVGRTGDLVVSALDGVGVDFGWDRGGGGNIVKILTDLGGAKVYCYYLHLTNWSANMLCSISYV